MLMGKFIISGLKLNKLKFWNFQTWNKCWTYFYIYYKNLILYL